MTWEFAFLDFIQEHLRCAFLDWFFPKFTLLGNNGYLWIALAIILLAIPKTRKTGFIVALSLIFDLILCNIIVKPLVARIRPYDINTEVSLLIQAEKDFSFPSGHTAVSFAAVTALFRQKSLLRWPMFCVAVLISLSRLYLYVHYPTDIIGGVLFGIIAGLLGSWSGSYLCKLFSKKLNQ